MAATETITSIILIKLIRVSLGTVRHPRRFKIVFFFNDTATTEIYTLSLHDALPISRAQGDTRGARRVQALRSQPCGEGRQCSPGGRSEEHTFELQSLAYLVCRLLLEKKKRWQQRKP